MPVSKMCDIPRKWLLRLALLCLVLSGLALVLYYTYLNIRHDMALIAAKQQNVFEVFYQRARILKPNNLAQFVDGSSIKSPIFSKRQDVLVDVYAYDTESRDRLAVIPIMSPNSEALIAYQYALSYPEVINVYAYYDDHRLLGMVANEKILPRRLLTTNTKLDNLKPWLYFFSCTSFTEIHLPCSPDEAYVSDIYTDTFTQLKTITMYFPFVFYDTARRAYRHGLSGIDLSIDEAFKDVFHPFETLNPTRTVISFDAAEPCRPWHICLNTRLMQTKTGKDLYLKWSYDYGDFMKVVLHGSAFQFYLIALLLLMLTGPRAYAKLLTLGYTDHLTKLPRRDILDHDLLQQHDYLMILDIDNFKSVNDLHGHGVGDIALIAFARHLQENIRKGDCAIRWGGEEFIALYKGLGNEVGMRHAAARLLEQPLQIPQLPNPITFSAGIIHIHEYMTVPNAITLADELLYHVKQHGKHNIAYHQEQGIALIRATDAQATTG